MTKSETVSQPCDTTLLCHMAETVSDFVMFHLEEFALKPGFIFTVYRKQLKSVCKCVPLHPKGKKQIYHRQTQTTFGFTSAMFTSAIL